MMGLLCLCDIKSLSRSSSLHCPTDPRRTMQFIYNLLLVLAIATLGLGAQAAIVNVPRQPQGLAESCPKCGVPAMSA
ncbi:unnamed protein product [Mycena citricolor]|uniref:Uncharacterized protein n=1 Tax=Mycena citricolor TaxID=2018698 RepID=A0AAD2HJ40_9AGAR|nr:unnamed protein product [Mycena citricolor]